MSLNGKYDSPVTILYQSQSLKKGIFSARQKDGDQ